MNLKHLCTSLLLVVAAVALISCDDDEETTYNYLDGTLSFDLEPYLKPGTTVTLTPTGVSHPDDLPIGYYWTISSLLEDNDTTKFAVETDTGDGTLEYCFSKDTLGTFTVTCAAFADDYYNSSSYSYVVTVKAGLNTGSITGISTVSEDDFIFTDDREEQPQDVEYYTCCPAGDKLWFKQNLAYTDEGCTIGLAYLDSEAVGDVLGRFYSWEEAQTVCPSGYHLPSEAELMAVAQQNAESTLELEKTWYGCAGQFMSYAYFNGDALWEYWPDVKVTDSYGLAVLPMGYCMIPERSFNGIAEMAVLWTSDSYDTERGVYRYIVDDQPDIFRGAGDKQSFGASVRCVQD